jgi:sn-glycerol 3-phosphate transport system substrate-binding protein
MKRNMAMLSLLVILSFVLAACGGTPAPTGPTKITWWHAMSGTNGTAIDNLTAEYNKSQTKCVTEAVFQASYDDMFNKIKAGLQSKDVPALAQIYDLGTRFMYDLDAEVPMQTFIDRDKYKVSDIETNIMAYYSVNNKLYSMPFNTSNPILYYNVNAFREAGLNPNAPPRTFDDIAAAAKKLTKKDASGKVTQYGYSMAIYGWFFEQLLAVSNAQYLNNGNGRDSLATAATINGPEAQKIVTWWKQMYDDGILGNYGRTTADTQKAFDAQQTAMMIESTAGLRARLNAAAGKFELGTGFLPRPSEDMYQKSGTIIGGASLWIFKDRPKAEQDCAWDMVKFLVAPHSQAVWHTQTGYYPVNKAGYEDPLDVAWRQQFPQFQTAIDQLHMSPNTRVTQGAFTGIMPQARQEVELAIESVIAGKATVKDALDKAQANITAAILDYNKNTAKK